MKSKLDREFASIVFQGIQIWTPTQISQPHTWCAAALSTPTRRQAQNSSKWLLPIYCRQHEVFTHPRRTQHYVVLEKYLVEVLSQHIAIVSIVGAFDFLNQLLGHVILTHVGTIHLQIVNQITNHESGNPFPLLPCWPFDRNSVLIVRLAIFVINLTLAGDKLGFKFDRFEYINRQITSPLHDRLLQIHYLLKGTRVIEKIEKLSIV